MSFRTLYILPFLLLCSAVFSQENTALFCSDGIDNDGDGNIDCEDMDCQLLPSEGCATCFSGISFGDEVIASNIGSPTLNESTNTNAVLGVANYNGDPQSNLFVSLGEGGWIEIGFTNNNLVNSGDNGVDLWVFEVGDLEGIFVDLRPADLATMTQIESTGLSDLDGDGYYRIDEIGVSTSGLDIDRSLPGFAFSQLRFDAVKLLDAGNNIYESPNPGSDIDAICALSNIVNLENTSLLCSDGIDNDGDGVIDCDDPDCQSLPNNGCVTCNQSGASFGDEILFNGVNCDQVNVFNDPNEALGVADYNGIPNDGNYVSLGSRGFIDIGFTNNLLVNSGDDAVDLWVFEIGPAVESMNIELKPFDQLTIDRLLSQGLEDPDLDGYFDMGNIDGSTSGLDIDNIIPGFVFADLRFDAVRVRDLFGNCDIRTPGADIDAICALSGVQIDCQGTVFGTAIIDDCGICNDPLDSLFNLSCSDCAGNFGGTAILDLCGDCFEPDDPLINQACAKNKDIYIPNIISTSSIPDNQFSLQGEEGAISEVLTYAIYDRWGSLVFGFINQPTPLQGMTWWNGSGFEQGVYAYFVEVRFYDGELAQQSGPVTVIK